MEHVSISSSWLVVNGDVCTIDGRRWNGKKKGPRKKRGPALSDDVRRHQSHLAQLARERRRGGFKISARD